MSLYGQSFNIGGRIITVGMPEDVPSVFSRSVVRPEPQWRPFEPCKDNYPTVKEQSK